MKKINARIGIVLSLCFHAVLFAGIGWVVTHTPLPAVEEQQVQISMEMLATQLQQPEIATAPETETAMAKQIPTTETQTVEPEVEAIPESEPTPAKVIEKPKEKEKPKLKEPPKEKVKPKMPEKLVEKPKEVPKAKSEKPSIKAVQVSPEVKQGIVAKAIPQATSSVKAQTAVSTTPQSATSNNVQASSSANEISAYKAQLQRALQQRAGNSYPPREKMMRKEGVVTISLLISPSGQVTNVSVIKSSGNSNLDAAAVKAAESTKMSSPPPAGFPTNLTVPIRFSIS